MLYMVFKGKVKEGQVEDFFANVAAPAQKVTLEKDSPVAYQWLRDQDDQSKFLLYETWNDVDHIHTHFETLYEVFGPARPTERLPSSILDYLEEADVSFYDVIEG
ncbi:MAG: putative quinol monooxygenase [Pseudomonadales bacterium]